MPLATFRRRKRDSQLITVFDAFGDATRLRMIRLITERNNICVSELADEVGITTSGASQQLKLLEASGVVNRFRKGQKICYKVNHEDEVVKDVMRLINKER